MPGPLDGIRVVDLTQLASGPLATCILADQGADVIKVERPGSGDMMRHMSISHDVSAIFATLNRNKRSIALDLSSEPGRQLLGDLVASSDVFVQNFRPGVADRMGIGCEHLQSGHPRLVYVSISGFGDEGPYAQRKVFDSVIQVLAGFAAAQGDGGEPKLMRNMICDKLSALSVAQAITAALLQRDRGGPAAHVRLNMLDACIAFFWPDGMAAHTVLEAEGQPAEAPRGRAMTLRRLSDGYMTISGVPQAEFEGICRAIGRPELIDDPRLADPAARQRNIDFYEEAVDAFTRQRSVSEVSELLIREGVPHGHVNDHQALPRDPQVVQNRTLAEVAHPAGVRLRMPRPVAQFGDAPREIRLPPPGLGEHTDAILAELGLDSARIQKLRADAIVS